MVLLLITLLAVGSDPRTALVGTWSGESICTDVRPACHDEQAVYHIVLAEKRNEVSMTMNKLVNDQEVTIGTLDYKVDSDATHLSSEFQMHDLHGLWSFTRADKTMTGTLKLLPGGEVVRNIRLKKR